MKQSKAPLVSDVVAMRATEYSADGRNVVISLTTKYTSERLFSVPVTCLRDFIADLEKLKSPTASSSATADKQSGKSAKPIEVPGGVAAQPAENQVKVTVPKKWMLASGLPNHPLVILILDPQTKTQAGFGFSDGAAREMAAGLVKYADQIATNLAGKTKLS
jgi:hypothetical protein